VGTQGGAQPNSLTPQPQTLATPQSQSLNPQIVKLADSIAKTESGGKSTATGKSGEYGAYQWLPQTWDAESKAAGISVPLNQSTPEQQNQVAYNQISNWKNEGLTPAQIASKWNSNDPNAYLGTFEDGNPAEGTNSSGAQYDVPGYVSKVMNLYDGGNSAIPTANAASSPTGNKQSSGQPDWLTALEGLGIGAVGGLWGLAQKPLADAATDAAVGATVGSVVPGEGTVAGGVAGGIAGLVQGVGQDIFGGGNNNQNTQTQTASSGDQSQPQPQAETSQPEPESASAIAASTALKDAINQTMQGTQSNRVFSSSSAGQDAIKTAAQFGLVEPDENGNLAFNSDKFQQLESAIERGKDGVIASQENASASPLAVGNYAGNYIGNNRLSTDSDRKAAAKIVQNEMASDLNGIPPNGQMSLSGMREKQKQHYAAAKNAYKEGNYTPTPKHLAHKALGNAYGKAIEDKISEEDKPLFKKLTRASSDLMRAKEVGKRLNGKKAPKNKGIWESFLRQGARAAEIYIGDKLGGPVGAIIGGLAGEHINNKITQKFGRNIFETKGMRSALDLLRDTKPKEYQRLIDALEKRGEKIPKDEKKKPTGKEGLVKLVKKDIQDIVPAKKTAKPQKGLVDLKPPSKKGGLISLRSNTAKP
jgi:hypothetical protein